MNKCQLFMLIYFWAMLNAMLISSFILPYIKEPFVLIFGSQYITQIITFIMISLVMPLVFWIEVPMTIYLFCHKKDNPEIK